ncbi:hypothetical protein BpOF4_01360 [Alkalihalophilus pseudofirmus OF4]|uniref:Uncharacterized protein n=1 Tax=Alkalihalophilus pseudofirmus (strain ATCC BAA-2126 / JCM 17055 / OF4) TaxID=398511 RepID=D3FUD8_ALKPO|nr:MULTISPECIES: hypothetical protein [Alkalihalophilus]ADC48340.1 hypothetical protein BpOF4_01360 [Alkalihalophilus pseudofirmus OF4]MED1601158.1 hypothetical protein [Alkalihalophilus marmarensis]
MKKSIIISIGSVVIVIAGIGIYSLFGGDNEIQVVSGSEEEIEIEVQEDDEDVGALEEEVVEETPEEIFNDGMDPLEIRETIQTVHGVLNRITGHGQLDIYRESGDGAHIDNFNKIESNLLDQANLIEKVIPHVQHELLRKDLENFVAITRYVTESWEVEHLLYSHRIIHDVETVLNEVSGKNIFGAAAFVASAGYEPAAYEAAVKPLLNDIPKEGSEE